MKFSKIQLLSLGKTLAISISGAALFVLLHIPLAWLLGPLTFSMIWNRVTSTTIYWPAGWYHLGLMLLGYMLGSSFTSQIVRQIISQLPAMLIFTILTVAFSILTGWITSRCIRVHLCSGILGSIPGGLTQMVALCQELKYADGTIVTVIQTIRLMSVLFIVPFLVFGGILNQDSARNINVTWDITEHVMSIDIPWLHYVFYVVVVLLGSRLGALLRLPVPYLLGALIATAIPVLQQFEAPALPGLVYLIAQLFVGTHIGKILKPDRLKNWQRIVPLALLSGIGLIGFSLLCAIMLTHEYPMTLVTAFLSTAPGGIAEMGATSRAVQANLAIVSAYQMFRLFFILFVVSPLLKWWFRRADRSR